MTRPRIFTPFTLPIYCFLAAIVVGAVLLHMDASRAVHYGLDAISPITWLDALFTATSAVCVTGLTVVDTGTSFSLFGQGVILALIQIGGLGVMTYTSLIFYLWRRRVSLTDRLAVGQSLLHDPTFRLGRFLLFVVVFTLGVELAGAVALLIHAPKQFNLFSATFHSISAFCNAGFSLNRDSLVGFKGDIPINLVFIVLITLGGLGFSVVNEVGRVIRSWFQPGARKEGLTRLSFHAHTVLYTSLFLVVAGALILFLAEYLSPSGDHGLEESLLAGVFQSVTCRTAGFNTVDLATMTNVSLLFMILLMFIGGSPGSCAGGVKTTTFRVIVAFIVSQMRGRKQTVVHNRALDSDSLNKALTLAVFGMMTVFVATLVLMVTEGSDMPHSLGRDHFLDILFEVVSAFGTVGLSTGLTPHLSVPGKLVVCVLMYVGRLGPILFLQAMAGLQRQPRYTWAEESLMIG